MKNNPKYNPEDIEDLLLHKSFDELHESEQAFVLQHIDSIKEYKELRNTLLSIKDYSQNSEQITSEPKVKEELLELFEKENRKPFYWFNLNSIGTFLFPTNTPIFRKPAFQIATFAILALFVVNIGNNLNKSLDNNLAQNKIITSEESKVLNIPKKTVEKPNLEKVQKEILDFEQIETEEITIKEDKVPLVESIIGNNNAKYREVILEDQVEKTKGYFKAVEAKDQNRADFRLKDRDVVSDKKEIMQPGTAKSASKEFRNEVMEDELEEVAPVTLSSTVARKTESISDMNNMENINSQSLENNEELIDLLYITM